MTLGVCAGQREYLLREMINLGTELAIGDGQLGTKPHVLARMRAAAAHMRRVHHALVHGNTTTGISSALDAEDSQVCSNAGRVLP